MLPWLLGLFQTPTSTNRHWKINSSRPHQELKQEKQHGQTLENIIIVLGIGCVVLLITGAAIGSKCRRDFKSDGGDEQ